MKKAEIQKNFLFLSPLVLLFLLLVSIFIIFRIRKVIIVSNTNKIYGLAGLENKNILITDSLYFSKYLIDQNRHLRSIKVSKSYPDTLILKLDERAPKALVQIGDKDIYIDGEGIVPIFGQNGNRLYPVIEIDSSDYSFSGKLDWRLQNALIYLDNLQKFDIHLSSIFINSEGSNFILRTNDGIEIVIPEQKDPINIITSLQMMISRFRIEGKFVKKVDFSFDKPVVVFAHGEKNYSK